MFENFRTTFPEVDISRSYYIEIFRTQFALRFGKPQVDTCCFCEEIDINLENKSLSKEERAAFIITKAVHKKTASKFYLKLHKIEQLSKQRPDTLGISIDYMMNITLPLVPEQESHYSSKLTVNVFAIKNFKTGNSEFFL